MDSTSKSQSFFSFFSSSGADKSHDEYDSGNSRNEKHKMKGVVLDHLEERIRPYIDVIDALRSVGIQNDMALPTIVVVGDQSSGKSSVLEALSGVALPRGSGIVTRCPLELRLRRVRTGLNWKAVISYRDKTFEIENPSAVEHRIVDAQNELAGKGVGICHEPITLAITSPDVCDLTLIDLPGIARVPIKGQPDDIGKQIKDLILKFIDKSETLNMVVVPCNNDIATTEALKMAQEVDPEGKRTVAILTKPDLIDKGTEKNILAIVRNKVIPLSKGYIMVKCRGQRQIDDKISLEKALQMEMDFFRSHEDFSCLVNEDKATVKCLATKLSQYLVEHIKKSLPLLSEKIKNQLWNLRNEHKECEAGPPLDPQEARNFLITTLTGFNEQIRQLSSGELISDNNLYVQLRAEFKKWNDHLESSKDVFKKSAEDFKKDSQKYRGRELLGFSNYKVFEVLLQDHLRKLKMPAIVSLNTIKEIIHRHFTDVSQQCFQNYPFLLKVTMNKIDNIHLRQQALTEQRILEQFEMENMIYTQDTIHLKALNEMAEQDGKGKKYNLGFGVSKEESMGKYSEEYIFGFEVSQADNQEKFSEENIPGFDKKVMYTELLRSYYEIVVQRMADQVPMLVLYLMLKETARLLCTEMLSLMDGAKVKEILCEDSEVSKRRIEIETSLDRLNIAEEKIRNFV